MRSGGLWAFVCGVVVAQTVSIDMAALGPACEAQAIESSVYPRPVQVLGQCSLPPVGPVMLGPSWSLLVPIIVEYCGLVHH